MTLIDRLHQIPTLPDASASARLGFIDIELADGRSLDNDLDSENARASSILFSCGLS
jgi:hypothetical protein